MRTTNAFRALLLALTVAPPLTAQTTEHGAVFVAVPETFPDLDARAVVIREPGKDIIVLRPDEMDPEALAMALRVLRRAQGTELPPGRGQMIPITGFVFPDGIGDEERRRMVGVLGQLGRQPVTRVGNLGPGRWVRYTER